MSSEAVEILESMKEILLEGGWCQRTVGNVVRGQPTCLVGSYLIHTGQLTTHYRAVGLNELGQVVGRSLIGWNDTPGRTFNEVIDAIDRAIILAKETQGSTEQETTGPITRI